MNLTKSDKSAIKKFITTFLSFQAIFGIAILATVIVFGSMIIKDAHSVQASVQSNFEK